MDYFPDPASAFDTYLDLDSNLSPEEFEAECQRLVERQQAIAGLLAGTVPLDYVEAMLDEHGIDPYQWAEVGESNLVYMLNTWGG